MKIRPAPRRKKIELVLKDRHPQPLLHLLRRYLGRHQHLIRNVRRKADLGQGLLANIWPDGLLPMLRLRVEPLHELVLAFICGDQHLLELWVRSLQAVAAAVEPLVGTGRWAKRSMQLARTTKPICQFFHSPNQLCGSRIPTANCLAHTEFQPEHYQAIPVPTPMSHRIVAVKVHTRTSTHFLRNSNRNLRTQTGQACKSKIWLLHPQPGRFQPCIPMRCRIRWRVATRISAMLCRRSSALPWI